MEPNLNTTSPDPAEQPAATHVVPPPKAKADVGKRIVAYIIDAVLAGVAFAILSIALPGFFGDLVAAVVAGGYMLVKDGLALDFMDGRSLGKKVMKLRPNRLDGAPMTIEASVKRNWMFGIGYFNFIPFIGVLLGLALFAIGLYEVYRIFTDPEGRRWGDDLAGTKVVEVAS